MLGFDGILSLSRLLCSLSLGLRFLSSAALVIATLSAVAQLVLVPKFAREAYLLRSTSLYSPQERQQADAVFGRYRHERRSAEPAVASAMLSRYMHDRDLFWQNRLHNGPVPIWMLGDSADPPLSGSPRTR